MFRTHRLFTLWVFIWGNTKPYHAVQIPINITKTNINTTTNGGIKMPIPPPTDPVIAAAMIFVVMFPVSVLAGRDTRKFEVRGLNRTHRELVRKLDAVTSGVILQ